MGGAAEGCGAAWRLCSNPAGAAEPSLPEVTPPLLVVLLLWSAGVCMPPPPSVWSPQWLLVIVPEA